MTTLMAEVEKYRERYGRPSLTREDVTLLKLLAEQQHQEGRQEGLREGLQEGIQAGGLRRQIGLVEDMLDRGASWATITELTGEDREGLHQLRKALGAVRMREDVTLLKLLAEQHHQEGRQEGLREGRREGAQAGGLRRQIGFVEDMLDRGASWSTITELTGMDREDLHQLRKALGALLGCADVTLTLLEEQRQREDRRKGLREGVQVGGLRNQIGFVEGMLDRGTSWSTITELTGMDREGLHRLREELNALLTQMDNGCSDPSCTGERP